MTYQEKVKAIYEAMADRTLSFGCMYNSSIGMLTMDKSNYRVREENGKLVGIIGIFGNPCMQNDACIRDNQPERYSVYEIIGHPIHIGVVLDWIDKKYTYRMEYFNMEQVTILSRPKGKLSQPLPLNPTEERYPVIDFITSLLDQGT